MFFFFLLKSLVTCFTYINMYECVLTGMCMCVVIKNKKFQIHISLVQVSLFIKVLHKNKNMYGVILRLVGAILHLWVESSAAASVLLEWFKTYLGSIKLPTERDRHKSQIDRIIYHELCYWIMNFGRVR